MLAEIKHKVTSMEGVHNSLLWHFYKVGEHILKIVKNLHSRDGGFWAIIFVKNSSLLQYISHDSHNDQQLVFLSNLPYQVTTFMFHM